MRRHGMTMEDGTRWCAYCRVSHHVSADPAGCVPILHADKRCPYCRALWADDCDRMVSSMLSSPAIRDLFGGMGFEGKTDDTVVTLPGARTPEQRRRDMVGLMAYQMRGHGPVAKFNLADD